MSNPTRLPARPSSGASRSALLPVLTPVVTAAGLDLEDVEVVAAGRRRLLRLLVDRDGGVGLDDVAAVSNAVSAELDRTDVMGGAPYVLEVSSPGVDRPLTAPRHWRRAIGRLVRVELVDGSTDVGRVRAVEEHAGVSVEVAGTEGAVRALGWDELRLGRVQVEFSRVGDAEDGSGDSDEDRGDDDDEDESGDGGGEGRAGSGDRRR